MTTTTLDLTAAVEQMLHPFARFGVPAHELGMIMGIALRFFMPTNSQPSSRTSTTRKSAEAPRSMAAP